MLGVHSLTPVKLTVGTTTVKTKPTIRRVTSSTQGPDSEEISKPPPPPPAAAAVPEAKAEAAPVDTPQADVFPETSTSAQRPMAEVRQEAPATGGVHDMERREQVPLSVPPVMDSDPHADEAGPSRPVSHVEPALANDLPPPEATETRAYDETHTNAISYRRDPETVIAYLVALPAPSLQGKTLAVAPKYFLYAPPPPHLVKPAHGGEGYAVRLTRHWQQSVRRATRNAHNGKRVSWRGTRSKVVRGCVQGLNKLKYDDVAFLARIHPRTVTHLILIHPTTTITTSSEHEHEHEHEHEQTPAERLATFRAQIFASKARAKRNSIISAALFLPALAIDTAAVFFGGLAEIDGIWMLVSVTAYRTARLITQKMGPDPKTLDISQAQLIADAQRLHPHPDSNKDAGAEDDEAEGGGALRKSVDALRRGVGSVKHRMSLQARRERKGRKSESAERASTEGGGSRPQTRASQGFVGGELGDHVEEGHHQNSNREADMSGVLEHGVESEEEGVAAAADTTDGTTPSRPTATTTGGGGLFQDDTAMSTDGDGDGTAPLQNKGQNFQLTFYPSPAMEILDRYMQNACHVYNGRAFSGPVAVPSEAEVLAVMGWSPERRAHLSAEEQQEDEEWQAREIQDDLRLVAAKAAKSWDKSCRKEAKRARRPMTGGGGVKTRFRRPQRTEKGKATQSSPETSDVDLTQPGTTLGLKQRLGAMRGQRKKKQQQNNQSDGQGRETSGLKQRLAAMRNKSGTQEKKEQKTSAVGAKVAGAAALLCVPCIAVSQRVQHKKQQRSADQAEQMQEKKKRTPTVVPWKGRFAAARKSKRTSPQHDAESTGIEAPTTADQEASPRTSKKKHQRQRGGGILGGLTALLMGIQAKISHKHKTSDATQEKATKTRGSNNRFSALKARIQALRTRIVKRRKGAKKTMTTTTEEEGGDSPKTHSAAMVGLVAGCLALPGLNKVQALREKRRKTKRHNNKKGSSSSSHNDDDDDDDDDDTTPDMPTQLQGMRSDVPQPGGPLTAQPPVPIPEEDEEGEGRETREGGGGENVAQALVETQYLPGHGQSEIPVTHNVEPPSSAPSPGSTGPQMIPSAAAAAAAAASAGESTTTTTTTPSSLSSSSSPAPPAARASTSSAAAVKFRSIREGMGHFTTRARHSTSPTPSSPLARHAETVGGREEEEGGDEAVMGSSGGGGNSSPLASPRGRFTFKTLRPGTKGRNNNDNNDNNNNGGPQPPNQEDAHLVLDLDAGIQPTVPTSTTTNGNGNNDIPATESTPTTTTNNKTTTTTMNGTLGKLAQGLPFKRKGAAVVDHDDNQQEGSPSLPPPPPVEEKKKQYKDRKPGFGDRMRVLWYMA